MRLFVPLFTGVGHLKRWGARGLGGLYRVVQQRETQVHWIMNCYKLFLRGLVDAIFHKRESPDEKKLLESDSGPSKHFRLV